MNIINRVLIRIIFPFFCMILIGTYIVLSTNQKIYIVQDKSTSVKGKLLWQSHKCNTCHSLFGLGGHLGPDLSNVYSQKGGEYIKYMLINGRKKMPAFSMSDEEMNNLVSYLNKIDDLVEYPLRSYDAPVFGKIKNTNAK